MSECDASEVTKGPRYSNQPKEKFQEEVRTNIRFIQKQSFIFYNVYWLVVSNNVFFGCKITQAKENDDHNNTRNSTFDLNLIKLSFEQEKLCSDTTVASNSQS